MSDAKYLSTAPVTSNLHKTIPFITFRPHPTNLDAYLEEKSCFDIYTQSVLRVLLDHTNLNEIIEVHHGIFCYSGITLYISCKKIAQKAGCSPRKAAYALKQLADCEVIEKLDQHPETGCNRYKLNCYDDAIDYLKANPDHPRCQVETLEPSQEQIRVYAQSAMDLLDRFESLESPQNGPNGGYAPGAEGYEPGAYNKEYKERNTPYTAAALERNILEPPAQQEQHEVGVDLNRATREHPEPETVEEEKNSLRAKEGGSVFVSVSFSLADRFAGDAAEYVDDGLRKERVGVIEDYLCKMFRDAAIVKIYPDADRRAEACAEVMKVWITIVKHLEHPPDQIGFINGKFGRKLLADAKAKVFGAEKNRQKWENGEAGTETGETSTKQVPTTDAERGWTKEAIETYEQMYGPDWRDMLRERKFQSFQRKHK